MSRTFLFGGNQSSSQSQYLVQMKAGKMVRNGNTVSPVKDKKGLLYLHQSSDDSLMHFCWKDRTSGQVEDDLIIFPDDAEFLKVPQCTTGRVFVLKFKTSPRRLFFWSQEPKDDKDEEIVSKINEYINNPMAAANRGNNQSHVLQANELGADEEFRNLFSGANVSAQQLMSMLDAGLAVLPNTSTGRIASLLGPVNQNAQSTQNRQPPSAASTPAAPQTPSTTPAIASSNSTSENSSTTGGNTSSGGLRLVDLQNIISGLSGAQSEHQSPLNVDLSTSINIDVLRPLLTNDEFMKQVADKLPKISSSEQNLSLLNEQFTQTVQSPQFQQALNSFSQAIQSGQIGPLIQQFGLPEGCVSAANTGNFESFVKALQASYATTTSETLTPSKPVKEQAAETGHQPSESDVDKQQQSKSPDPDKKKEKKFDDDSMALD